MIRFREYASDRDGAVATPSSSMDRTELLQRIVQHHGSRFRTLLKKVITSGDLDDDPDLLSDIRELYQSIGKSSSDDQYPVNARSRPSKELDIVTRPKADGGSGPGGSGGGVGMEGGD